MSAFPPEVRREGARLRAAEYVAHARGCADRLSRLVACAAALFAILHDGNALERAQARWLLDALRAKGSAAP